MRCVLHCDATLNWRRILWDSFSPSIVCECLRRHYPSRLDHCEIAMYSVWLQLHSNQCWKWQTHLLLWSNITVQIEDVQWIKCPSFVVCGQHRAHPNWCYAMWNCEFVNHHLDFDSHIRLSLRPACECFIIILITLDLLNMSALRL